MFSKLLPGAVALEKGMIEPAMLVEAVQTWLSDKSVSLTQILADLEAITDADQARLTAFCKAEDDNARTGDDVFAPIWQQLAAFDDDDVNAFFRLDQGVAADRGGEETVNLASVERAPVVEQSSDSTVGQPRYRLLRHHARGGLGEVSVALDMQLKREVAFKQIRPQYAGQAETQARFVREAELNGALEHPGIVPVYSLGRTASGRHYYAMRFVRGHSLQDAIREHHQAQCHEDSPAERTLKLRQLLRRFVDVCNAIEYAHSRGIVHRDLKPDNIMLGKFGETLVVDWGLAKDLSDWQARGDSSYDRNGEKLPASASPHTTASDAVATAAGSVIGTPAYMSPEQVDGAARPASDIYSLGATLYVLLTGTLPIEEKGLDALFAKIRASDFQAPHKIARVPKALSAISCKAMSGDPNQRYGSATELADDIERWLADEPLECYPEPWSASIARGLRRHSLLSVGLLTGLLTSTVLIGLAFTSSIPHRLGQVALTQPDKKQVEHRVESLRRDTASLARLVFTAGKPSNSPESERARAYEQTVAILERLATENPQASQFQYDLAISYQDLAEFYQSSGAADRASIIFPRAIALNERLARLQDHSTMVRDNLTYCRCSQAWILAACPNETVRNGREARRYAEAACKATDWRNPDCLAALAAAQAETGNFDIAVTRITDAIRLAPKTDRAKLTEQLDCYSDSVPYRDTTLRTSAK